MKFTPLSNYVLILPAEQPNTTPSGIMLPESTKDKPNQGIVIETGEGIRNEQGQLIPVSVKRFDKVLFQKYSGVEVKLEDKKYLLMRETDILGIISG